MGAQSSDPARIPSNLKEATSSQDLSFSDDNEANSNAIGVSLRVGQRKENERSKVINGSVQFSRASRVDD